MLWPIICRLRPSTRVTDGPPSTAIFLLRSNRKIFNQVPHSNAACQKFCSYRRWEWQQLKSRIPSMGTTFEFVARNSPSGVSGPGKGKTGLTLIAYPVEYQSYGVKTFVLTHKGWSSKKTSGPKQRQSPHRWTPAPVRVGILRPEV